MIKAYPATGELLPGSRPPWSGSRAGPVGGAQGAVPTGAAPSGRYAPEAAHSAQCRGAAPSCAVPSGARAAVDRSYPSGRT